MKKCPNCGAQNEDDSLFCTECGKPIPQGNVCPHCGASMNEDDVFCTNCGKKKEESTDSVLSETLQRSCPSCGTSVSDGDSFCQNCGKSLSDISPSSKEKGNDYDDDVKQALTIIHENKSDNFWRYFIIAFIIISIVFALFFGGKYAYKAYSNYLEEKEERELFVKDSLEKVRQDSIKQVEKMEAERMEAEKIAKFQESFTIKNILNMLKYPEDKTVAAKSGLVFLYKDTESVEGYMDEMIEAIMIAYGYDVEKGEKREELGYEIKATSEHACYFKSSSGRWSTKSFHFKSKKDADHLIEMISKNGFDKEGDVYSNGTWDFFIPNLIDGWYEIMIRESY